MLQLIIFMVRRRKKTAKRKKAKRKTGKKKKVAKITSSWTTRTRRINGKRRRVKVRKFRGKVQVRMA